MTAGQLTFKEKVLLAQIIFVMGCILAVFGLVLAYVLLGAEFPTVAYFFLGLFLLKLIWNVLCPFFLLTLIYISYRFPFLAGYEFETVPWPSIEITAFMGVVMTVLFYRPEGLMQYALFPWMISGHPIIIGLKVGSVMLPTVILSYLGFAGSVLLCDKWFSWRDKVWAGKRGLVPQANHSDEAGRAVGGGRENIRSGKEMT